MNPNRKKRRVRRAPPRSERPRVHAKREEGFALLMAIIAIAILAVLVTDLHETTGTSFAAAMSERDHLRAEYMAKSGVNLTRMLIGQERNLRQLIDPLYRMSPLKRSAPQIPVWRFAEMILKPFSDFESSKEDVASAGYDLDMSEGLGETHASFEIHAAAENGKINLNDPRIEDQNAGHANVAMQLYALMGGPVSPNKYDPLFSQFDEKGRLTTRLDIVANVIDWWDRDENRTNYDPVTYTVNTSGGEDTDFYRSQPQPYMIKNAPFDSIEELRLVRGIGDDFWATFVEPTLDDPSERAVTVYGAAKVNPNEATPAAMLARLCTYPEVVTQPMCSDPTGFEQTKFVTLITMARSMTYGAPFFSKSSDFVNFITGKPDGLYGLLQTFLTAMGPTGAAMLFTPLVVDDAQVLAKMRRTFTTTARFIAIDVVGKSGNSQTRIRTVINTDPKWTPPPPNAGKLPPLGVFAYYRID
jgi:general secretion pathway protein K